MSLKAQDQRVLFKSEAERVIWTSGTGCGVGL